MNATMARGMREITPEEANITAQRAQRWQDFLADADVKFVFLGGTTYDYSLWAVRYPDGSAHIWRTPHDPCGRYVKAECRPWN